MAETCLFCNIIAGTVPVTLIYQDDHVVAFNDLHPQSPQHKLIIPRQHIATINDIKAEDTWLVGHLLKTAQHLAEQLAIAEAGYRVVMNCNRAGGQMVYHLHLHLLGGRDLSWPPG